MLQVGIIGYGRIGNEHASWISATDSLRVGKVYDPTPARLSLARSRGFAVTDRVEEIFDDPAIPIVLISAPTSMHFDLASAALQARKHVMVEKPMALDLQSSIKMKLLAQNYDRTLSVFHCRRWDIDYLTVKQLIDSHKLGRIFNIESRLGQWSSCVGPAAKEYRPGWRNEASYGGGGLYDWGSHFVDQLWQLYSPAKPVRVFAQLRGNIWTHDCDDFARVCIDFDNGGVALCEINTTTTRPLPRWHIDGTEGSADAPFSLAFDTNEWSKLTHTKTDGTIHPVDLAPKGPSESDIWQQFASACLGNGKPAVEVESVLMTMKLLDAARKSSDEGRVIDVSY